MSNIIILSDCINDNLDEGCIKLSNKLIRLIKKNFLSTKIITYNQKYDSDTNLKLNKLFLNKSLFSIIKQKKETTLIYIPFSSNTFGSILRLFILSVFTKANIYSVFVLTYNMTFISKLLLKKSKAKVICFSNDSYKKYKNIINKNAVYLKAAVDTKKFVPVSCREKLELRKKYNFNENDKIVLHIGHLKKGRNIDKILNISDEYKIILVVSSVTQKDKELLEKVNEKNNVILIDKYVENIEELYQLSDIYVFPVIEKENCIDVPLSVFEALSCNIKALITTYGELSEIPEGDGVFKISNLDDLTIEIKKIFETTSKVNTRNIALEYDWNNTLEKFETLIVGDDKSE